MAENSNTSLDAWTAGFSGETQAATQKDLALGEKPFSIYGYVVNFFNVNFYVQNKAFQDSDVGDTLYTRLKADWKPSRYCSFHAELYYQIGVGNMNDVAIYSAWGLLPFAQSNFPANDFQQKLAVDSGHWPLFRYDPRRAAASKEGNALLLDSVKAKVKLSDYVRNETRYRMLAQSNPEAAAHLLVEAQKAVDERWKRYKQLASI